MKKRFKLIAVSMLLAQVVSLVNAAKEEQTDFPTSVVQKKRATFFENKGPDEYEFNHDVMTCNGSYYYTRDEKGRWIDIKEHEKTSLAVTKDNYEDNNSFSKAAVALDATIYKKSFSNIYTVLDGSIHSKNDVDFYSYDAWGNGKLEVTLKDIPEECDYDIELYRMGNALNSSCDSSESVGSSKHISNQDEKISIDVIPGTYFLKVFSYKGFDEKNSYQLSFSFEDSEEEGKGKFDINEAKEKGEIAALWKSDFMPCSQNITNHSLEKSSIKYSNYNNYPLITHLADNYGKDEDIDYMCLYVWDNNVKKLIRYFATKMLDILNTKYKDGNPTLSDITWYFNEMSFYLSVAGTIMGVFPFDVTQILGLTLSALSVKFTRIANFFECINTKFKATASELRFYFTSLNIAMENTTDTVMMKIRYRFTKDWLSRYIDVHQTYRSTDVTVYNDDIVTSYEHIGSSMSGKVYGIATMDELAELLK